MDKNILITMLSNRPQTRQPYRMKIFLHFFTQEIKPAKWITWQNSNAIVCQSTTNS